MSEEDVSKRDIKYILNILFENGSTKVQMIATLRKLFRFMGRTQITSKMCKEYVEGVYEFEDSEWQQ